MNVNHLDICLDNFASIAVIIIGQEVMKASPVLSQVVIVFIAFRSPRIEAYHLVLLTSVTR